MQSSRHTGCNIYNTLKKNIYINIFKNILFFIKKIPGEIIFLQFHILIIYVQITSFNITNIYPERS